jgi:hypothetical protein
MAVSVRTRFEVFKRDEFTCRYCGGRSPTVVLEIDHIQPRCDGGSDDAMNLVTSCWDCNRGKSYVPLSEVITGEDPHDKAIEIVERRRQMEEYNSVVAEERSLFREKAIELAVYWCRLSGLLDAGSDPEHAPGLIGRRQWNWLNSTVRYIPSEQIKEFMDLSAGRGITEDMRWVGGCCRRWFSRSKISHV